MSDVGLYTVSGSMMPSISSSWAQLETASLNLKHLPEQRLYNNLIAGVALASLVGEAPNPNSPYPYAEQLATPPSWTGLNTPIPLAHGFVIAALSASQYEVSRLNAYFSGTYALEDTPVPASGNLYYSKQSRFVKKIYKFPAYDGLSAIASPNNLFPATDENNGSGGVGRAQYDPISGSYFRDNIWNPTVLNLFIPDYGKIRDLKVWVEFVHDHRGGTGPDNQSPDTIVFPDAVMDTSPNYEQGLQGVQISLRSPNVNFRYAHPLWNDPQAANFPFWTDPLGAFTSSDGVPAVGSVVNPTVVPQLLENSYLLWAGHACDQELSSALGTQINSFPDESNILTIVGQAIQQVAPSNPANYTLSTPMFPNGPPFSRDMSMAAGRGTLGDTRLVLAYLSGTVYQPYVDIYNGNPQGGGALVVAISSSMFPNFSSYTVVDPPLSSPPPYSSPPDENPQTPSMSASFPWVAIGTDGIVHVAYFMTSGSNVGNHNSTLKYAQYGNNDYGTSDNSAPGWFVQGVDTTTFLSGCYASLALDPNTNLPRIAYYDAYSQAIKFASSGTLGQAGSGLSGWTIKNVAYLQGENWPNWPQPALDIDQSGNAHIAYHNLLGGIIHAYQYNGMWLFELVDSPLRNPGWQPGAGYPVNIKIDPQSNIHILYASINGRNNTSQTTVTGSGVLVLNHAESGSNGYTYRTIDSSSMTFSPAPAPYGSGEWSDVKLDVNGRPWVTYTWEDGNGAQSPSYPVPSNKIRLAKFYPDLGWVPDHATASKLYGTEYVGGMDPCLAIDPVQNSPFVAYYNGREQAHYPYPGGFPPGAWGNWDFIVGSNLDNISVNFDYDTDIDMRTIFDDSADVPHPRHNRSLYPAATSDSPGASLYPTNKIINGSYPSPASASIGTFGYDPQYFHASLDHTSYLTGANFPWMLDDRIPPGMFAMLDLPYEQLSNGAPPPGWLTGGTVGAIETMATASSGVYVYTHTASLQNGMIEPGSVYAYYLQPYEFYDPFLRRDITFYEEQIIAQDNGDGYLSGTAAFTGTFIIQTGSVTYGSPTVSGTFSLTFNPGDDLPPGTDIFIGYTYIKLGGNAPNEWPTYGLQLGPDNIRPFYPLLDDVYVEREVSQPGNPNVFTLPPIVGRKKLLGFRPGLRGTEINGNWQLLLGVDGDYIPTQSGSSPNFPMIPNQRNGIWFRQFRLEFVIDQGVGLDATYSSKLQRFKIPGHPIGTEGRQLVEIISGSNIWDIGTNYMLVDQLPAYGRTIGITDSTGSALDDFAVFSQITGALADAIASGTVNSDILTTFLNNPFGTPYIPLSSGSSIPPSFDSIDLENNLVAKNILNSIVRPKTLIPQTNTLKASLNRLKYVKSTADKILDTLTSYENVGVSVIPGAQDALASGSLP